MWLILKKGGYVKILWAYMWSPFLYRNWVGHVDNHHGYLTNQSCTWGNSFSFSLRVAHEKTCWILLYALDCWRICYILKSNVQLVISYFMKGSSRGKNLSFRIHHMNSVKWALLNRRDVGSTRFKEVDSNSIVHLVSVGSLFFFLLTKLNPLSWVPGGRENKQLNSKAFPHEWLAMVILVGFYDMDLWSWSFV